MRKSAKQCLAWILAVVQLAVLFPLTALAENATATETPVLNKTVVGTVAFQSFNFLGDNDTGEDGTDYHTTFYYTDDYFAPSAINDAATSRTMLWSDLDNPELATCSFDFAIASYTSAEGDVIRASSQTWNNTDYSNKDKNVKQFLGECGFTNVEPHALTQRPTNDSIGYTLGSKEITVWNADTQKNETYTLIAVGCRGAGYGAEWASNITIGDPATNALPSNGRHYGFDHSAQIVCQGIRDYLSSHSITGKVKYWVTGFSRAAAVANLVAGYLTDGGSTYKTQQKDVYGYTWECPQAAKTANTNFTNYKNIHNILNPMDAVPKVSPDAFEHQRLGVDYQMPYHGNASTSLNDTLYRQMFEVLKTIAVGNGTDPDPLVDDKSTANVSNDGYVSPSKYPYNSKMTIYKMSGWQLIQDAIGGTDKLMSNFGTVTASGNLDNSSKLLGRSDGGWYIDQFIDHLIVVFLTSNAWIGDVGNNRTAIQNRTTFIQNYQNHFRNLLGYFLDFSGPAFLGLLPKLIDAIRPQLTDITNLGLGYAFYKFYNEPNGSFSRLNPLAGQFRGQPYKTALVYYAKSTAKEVANDMVSGFSDPQGISKSTMNTAMDNVVELVINLYAYELDAYESQYLGTSLRYLWEILCTHEQETVLSWIMSLDPNHMNRSARTITIPAGCDATLYEFRPEIEGNLNDDPDNSAPVVAEVKNGTLVNETLKDQRIYSTTSNGNTVIRYPASLQIRADIKSASASGFNTSSVRVADYQTTNAYINVSNGKRQYETTTLNTSNGFRPVTNTTATNVTDVNTALSNYGVALAAGDTLHILADEIGKYNESKPQTYSLSIDKAPDVTVLDYGTPVGDYTAGTDLSSAVSLMIDTTVSTNTLPNRTITTRQKQITVPASSVYFDDELTNGSSSDYAGNTSRLDWNAQTNESEGKTFWYQFRGTRIDLYCTTSSSTGYVQAMVTDANGNVIENASGQRMVKTMKSASDTTRYNVPTISFDGLDPNTDYYLKIYALKDANYNLDGIRVYHSANESDTDVAKAYEAAGEQDAKYVNLRALLLGSVSEETLSGNVAAGAVFYTDSGTSYSLTSSDYQTNSPKNEIYLKNGERVAFQIVGTYEKVAVGMSAPDSVMVNGEETMSSGSVTVTNGSGTKTQPIANALDTYYEINPAPDGSVVITNSGTAMISITNVKLSGDYTEPSDVELHAAPPLMVSKSLMRYAASFAELPAVTDEPEVTVVPEETPAVEEPEETTAPEETPEPTPIPTPTPTPTPEPTPVPTPTPTPNSVSSFLNAVFRSIGRLFGF